MCGSKALLPQDVTDGRFSKYLENHTCCKLLHLQLILKKADRIEELPSEIINAIRLADYRIPTNLLQYYRLFVSKVMHKKLSQNNILQGEDIARLTSYMQDQKKVLLKYVSSESSKSKSPETLPFREKLWNDYQQSIENSSDEFKAQAPILHEYAHYLLQKLQSAWNSPMSIVVENKHVLVVRQPVTKISSCIALVEDLLRNFSSIQEIHFFATEVLYIDCSLENETWHGMNILLGSKCIEVVTLNEDDKLLWNLSGNAGTEFLESAASAREPGQAGTNGLDGSPGDNGGNLFLIANEFIGINKLSILSFGGNGGNGQDGGNGKNGLDGTSGADACQSSLFSSTTIGRSNAEKIAQEIFQQLCQKTCCTSGNAYGNIAATKAVLETCKSSLVVGKSTDGHDFELVADGEGGERKATFLVKGTPGKHGGVGGFGGMGGVGGIGGREGRVSISYCCCLQEIVEQHPMFRGGSGKAGNQGKRGINGLTGEQGKDGHDIGYFLNAHSGLFVTKQGKYKMVSSSEPINSASIYSTIVGKHFSVMPEVVNSNTNESEAGPNFGNQNPGDYKPIISTSSLSSQVNRSAQIGVTPQQKPVQKKYRTNEAMFHIEELKIRCHNEVCCGSIETSVKNIDVAWWLQKFSEVEA